MLQSQQTGIKEEEQQLNIFAPKPKKGNNATRFPKEIKGKRQRAYLFQVYRAHNETKRMIVFLKYDDLRPLFGVSNKLVYQNYQNITGVGYIEKVVSHHADGTLEIHINDEQLFKMHEWFAGILPESVEKVEKPEPEVQEAEAEAEAEKRKVGDVIFKPRTKQITVNLKAKIVDEFQAICEETGSSFESSLELAMAYAIKLPRSEK